MAETYLIRRMFNWNNVWWNRLETRWEAKDLIHDVTKMEADFKEYKNVVMQHDLSKEEVIGQHMKDHGGDAVKKWFALTTSILIWIDNDLKALPDTTAHVKGLEKLKDVYKEAEKNAVSKDTKREYQEILVEIEKAEKNLKNMRQQLLELGEKDLQRIYKDLLNVIKAVETPDRETFMTGVIDVWKRESTSLFDYLAIRMEVKDEIKDYNKIKQYRDEAAKALKLIDEVLKGKKKGITTKEVKQFVEDMNKASQKCFDEVKDAFLKGTKAAVRSAIVMFTLIAYLNRLYKDEEKLAAQHEIPLATAQEMEKSVKDIFENADKEAHSLIQGVHAEQERLKTAA